MTTEDRLSLTDAEKWRLLCRGIDVPSNLVDPYWFTFNGTSEDLRAARNEPDPEDDISSVKLIVGRHRFYTQDFDGTRCSKCNKKFHEGEHYPIGDQDRCGCDGCWACKGRVLGCTCDVDWDKVYGHE